MSQQNLDDLIRDRCSYSDLVQWIQQQDQCAYLPACLKANGALQHYRAQLLQHTLQPSLETQAALTRAAAKGSRGRGSSR